MSKQFRVIAVALGLSSLSACSSGGSGVASPGASATTSNPAATPVATAGALQEASLHGGSPVLASGNNPNFSTSLPAIGTAFSFSDSIAVIMPASGSIGASVAAYSPSSGTTLTYQGTQTTNGVTRNIYELKQPALSLDTPNLSGSFITLADGRKVSMGIVSTLNFAQLGWWTQQPGSVTGPTYFAWGTTGYQTPVSGVPTSGTATYSGGGPTSAGVIGTMFLPSSGGITNVSLAGQAKVDVNFGTGGVSGSLTNMTAVIEGDAAPTQAWNNVALSGNLSGATMRGTTAVTNAPGSSLSMGSGATGTFSGALFGPNAQELGATWTLYDPSGNGKTAAGIVGAAKQ